MKEFIEGLLPYERDWFFLLNGSNSAFLDQLMYAISGSKVWILLYIFVVCIIFYKTPKKEALLVFAFFLLVFALCDQFSSGWVKPFFERLRPGHHPDFKDLVQIVNNHRGGGYSFISGHATNCFGFSVFLSLVFRNHWVTLIALLWASLISYSRIYLGMHFISDVVGGILAGTIIAVVAYTVLIPLRKKFFHIDTAHLTLLYPAQHGKWLAWVFAAYVLSVAVL
jgi:undecaprenyl-diphosphatase